MATQKLVSRTLTVNWDRPRFELLDRRSAVMAVFDELDLIDGFRTQDDLIALRLVGGRSVRVSMEALWIYELTGSPARDRGDTAGYLDLFLIVDRVAEILMASTVVPTISLQHLVGWPSRTSKAAACKRGARSMVNDAGELGLFDFAMLTDGRTASGWEFQAEYGVLGASDVPLRLARHLGRTKEQAPMLDEELFGLEFPPVATFVDSTWNRRSQDAVSIAQARELVGLVEEDADRLVAAFHAQVTAVPQHARS